MTRRIAIDIGGTFTDLVGLDQDTGQEFVSKTPSTPGSPEVGILKALRISGVAPDSIETVLLGTTVATNALLQRRGARVLYLTTAGFEDVLFIQRGNRRFHYDLTWEKPDPLPTRQDSIGVRERMDKDGAVLAELTDAEMERVSKLVRARLVGYDGDVAIAVNLLFSYANPTHEQKLGSFLARAFPEVPVSLSHRVAPVWREYERGSTTTADAYVKPIISRFIARTEGALAGWGYRGPLAIVKSNGGSMVSTVACQVLWG